MTNTPLQDIQLMQADVSIFDAWLHDAAGVYIQFGPGDSRPSLATLIAEFETVNSLAFRTSAYQSVLPASPLAAADAAAFTAGGIVILDTAEVLPNAVGMTCKAMRVDGGSVTLGAYNLTAVPPIVAEPTDWVFKQTGAGQVTFRQAMGCYYNWFGADPGGNAGTEVQTRQAMQYTELALDGLAGSFVDMAPGHYKMDVSQGVFFRSTHHLARPGTVWIDPDTTTVPTETRSRLGVFTYGVPATQTVLPNYLAGTQGELPGQFCMGSFDPTTCGQGLIWRGIDIVCSAIGGAGDPAMLGANKFLCGLQLEGVYGGVVADCWLVGLPNTGVTAIGSQIKYANVRAWVNGFYGGLTLSDSTRNGLDVVGHHDITTPSLTIFGSSLEGCDLRCNACSNVETGGDGDLKIIGGVNIGAGQNAIEGTYAGGYGGNASATQWTQSSVIVKINDLRYVPGAGNVDGGPANVGGMIYQYTQTGTTNAAGSGPAGTGTGIADGTAVCQFVGYMPASAKLPGSSIVSGGFYDGAIPSTLFVPWLGVVKVPPSLVSGSPTNSTTLFDFNGNNEAFVRIANVTAQNFGNTSGSPVVMGCSNGGDFMIDGLTLRDCACPNSAANALVVIEPSYLIFGNAQNNKSRVRVRNLQLRGNTDALCSTGQFYIYGNPNSYDIDGIHSDGGAGNLIYIEHTATAAPASGQALEDGSITNCRTAGQTLPGIFLDFKNACTLTNPIRVERNRLWGLNSAGSYNEGFLVLSGNAVALNGNFIVNDNHASYGAATAWPIDISSSLTGVHKLSAHNNRFNEGAWRLTFNYSNTVQICNNTSLFAFIDANDNGLPGERTVRSNAAPGNGSWSIGDQNWRLNPVAAGVALDACTTQGTTGGLMAACTVTGTHAQTTMAYALGGGGVPPSAGEYVQPGGAGTIYQVLNVNTTTLTLTIRPALTGDVAGGTALDYAAPVFKTLTLAA